MQTSAILMLSVFAAIIYGIIHDQITARICLEYFTVAHPRLIDSDSPTMLGLFWGVVATWWVGLLLGIGLAVAARSGSRPKISCLQLVRPIGILLFFMLGAAVLGGIIGHVTSSAGIFSLVEPFSSQIPEEKHVRFLTVGWAHSASYLAAFLGGVTLWRVTWRRRTKLLFGAN